MSGADRQSGAGRREVAYRLFAGEYDDATLQYAESDEERAPNYVVTPTGARANRLFVVGVLTEIESVSEGVLRARVADPTGAFVLYAGQYQPDAVTFLERADPPTFVAVTGKARTYEPEGADRVLTSVRPESINEVDAETRDRWTVQTAAHTLDRVATMADALERPERGEALRTALVEAGIDYGLADGIALAIEHYGTTEAYLAAIRRVAIQAAELVADERDGIDPLETAPDEGARREIEAPLTAGVDRAVGTAGAGDSAPEAVDVEAATDTDTRTQPAAGDGADTGTASPESDATAEVATPAGEPEPEPTTDTEPDAEPEPATASGVDTAEDGPGDFADYEPETDADADTTAGDAAEESTAAGELYEYDEEEREEIEAEFGTDFSSGTEVDDPGEADIETPSPDTDAEPDRSEAADTVVEEESSTEAESDTEEEPEPEPEPDREPATDADADTDADSGAVDLEDAAVAAMEALDEGDGAERDAVIEAVAEEHDADRGAVEDAIQDALMSGRCYEPGDDRLKAI